MQLHTLRNTIIAVATLLITQVAMAAEHKLVIQVSDDDVKTMNLAMNNASNVQQVYGMDNITIEIVAYGPGLQMLTKKHELSNRVSSLAMQNITFSACGNTMKAMAKKNNGVMPVLSEGVGIVPAGVGRIMELQEQGYTYIRP